MFREAGVSASGASSGVFFVQIQASLHTRNAKLFCIAYSCKEGQNSAPTTLTVNSDEKLCCSQGSDWQDHLPASPEFSVSFWGKFIEDLLEVFK